MQPARPARQRAALKYPAHWFKPEELLSFIELRPFSRRWVQLGLNDLDLQALQIVLMADPRGAEVIQGTGGLRKVRFSPPTWDMGKRGALRVCYAYFEEVAIVALALVYQKGEKDDLDDNEKAVLKGAIEKVGRQLMNRSYRCGPKPNAE